MIINPVTITMPRHELEALISASQKTYAKLKGDTARKRVLESAIDNATDLIAAATRQDDATAARLAAIKF